MPESQFKADPFVERLGDAIDAGALLAGGQGVLVGVSGGADSVALLHAMSVLSRQGRRNYRLTVGHLDHGLRVESADDAEFTADLARQLGIECIVERADTAAEARRAGEGLEHAARTLRYEFFSRAARRCGAEAVAVAHHADDNAETILFRIIRGTALRGLGGMTPSRDTAGGARIIRPMLGMRRDDVLRYCRRANLAWRDDRTNAETVYRRNFIRHELLPLIRERMNPQVDEALLRLAGVAQQAEAFIARQARRLLEQSISHQEAGRILIDLTVFSPENPIVRTTAIRLALQQLGAPQRDLSGEHLAAVDAMATSVDAESANQAVNLPAHFDARRQRNMLIISGPKK